MKKYRIVEYGINEFVVQERKLFLWYNTNDFDSSIYKSYPSKESAEKAINELVNYKASILKKKEDEKLRLKNAKYHYIEDK